jgi:phosphonate transport system substrate-binding protein
MKRQLFLLKRLSLPGIFLTLILCQTCKTKTEIYKPTYSADVSSKKVLLFGVPTQSYYEIHNLFVNYLNDHLQGARVQTVAAANFLGYMDKLDHQYFDITIANGFKALEAARNGYSIVGQVVEENYAGAILINKDSSINTLADLKGKTIATPGYPALGGHMLQMLYLSKKGVDVKKDIRLKYLESFESVFLNIYLGKCAAGFSTINSWKRFLKRRPELALKVEVKWVTPAIMGNAFLIRNDVDKALAEQLEALLLSMNTSEEGKKALAKIGYFRFKPADSNSYRPVKVFMEEYNTLVREKQ